MEAIVALLSELRADVDALKERDNRLTQRIDYICQKIDSLKLWIMGLMAGIIMTFIAAFLK